MVGCPSVCVSHRLTAAGEFAAGCPAGRRYQQHGAHQYGVQQ